MNITNIHEFRSHGYANLAGKIIAMGAILPTELEIVKDRTHIGDTIRFVVDGVSDGGKGEVIKKYEHHCLCRSGARRFSVCWIDVVRGGK